MNEQLLRSTPEDQGVSTGHILKFIEAIEKEIIEERGQQLHSFMFLRKGFVIAEGWWTPFQPERRHLLWSLSKSFTATAIGLAIAEGMMSLEDKVISFFSEDVPEHIGENLAAMSVYNLLTMTTGHSTDMVNVLIPKKDENWVRNFLGQPVDYVPGTHFLYNTGATYMLSAILQKVTGQTLFHYLKPRLLDPLGISDATWDHCPSGVTTGGFGLSLKTEDIAKFGQLYLQKGVWNGKRILPQSWVEDATSKHISNAPHENVDWEQGYGYQFWRCQHNSYRADGAFGQFCVVMPEQDAVIAITSACEDMQTILNLIWRYLLPSMHKEPLPENASGVKALNKKLASLELYLDKSIFASRNASLVSGKQYLIDQNNKNFTAFSCFFDMDKCIVTLQDDAQAYSIQCGLGKWIKQETTINKKLLFEASIGLWLAEKTRIIASGKWADANNFIIIIQFIEASFCVTISCDFADNRVHLEFKYNVSFGIKDFLSLDGAADQEMDLQ